MLPLAVQKKCTQAEFQNEIKDLYSKCVLEDVGTFYFTYGELVKAQQYKVDLKFYDSGKQTMHTFFWAFSHSKRPHTTIAIDRDTFIFGEEQSWFILRLFDDGKKTTHLKKINIGRSEVVKFLSPQPPKPESLLSKVRNGSPGDFELKSNEGDLIEVHKAVLIPLWPFFAAAISSEMKEAQEKVLEVQCPTSTLEVLVRHVYDQELDLKLEDAANLIVVAQMYNLPELLKVAVQTIKSRDNTFDELLTVWGKSQEAKNDELKSFCARNMTAELVQSEEKVAELSKEDLLALFMDVAKLNIGKEEEGKREAPKTNSSK